MCAKSATIKAATHGNIHSEGSLQRPADCSMCALLIALNSSGKSWNRIKMRAQWWIKLRLILSHSRFKSITDRAVCWHEFSLSERNYRNASSAAKIIVLTDGWRWFGSVIKTSMQSWHRQTKASSKLTQECRDQFTTSQLCTGKTLAFKKLQWQNAESKICFWKIITIGHSQMIAPEIYVIFNREPTVIIIKI